MATLRTAVVLRPCRGCGGARLQLRTQGRRSLHNSSATAPAQRRHQPSRPPPLTQADSLLSQLPTRASYHSFDHPRPPLTHQSTTSATERAILTAAYARVPEHGFSAEALALGARDAGLLDISASALGDGPDDAVFGLIRWHLNVQREVLAAWAGELVGKSGAEDAAILRTVEDKVEVLAWERLLGNQRIIGKWQEALAVMAQPSYVLSSLRELAALADDIWYLAGDKAVDPTWYTKRAALSAAYSAAELYMTNDTSPAFVETRTFLVRRLNEARELGGVARSVGEWLGFTAKAGLHVLRSKGMPI